MIDTNEAKNAIAAAGLMAPKAIIADGRIHRFDADAKGGKTGWYIFFEDGKAGSFGCWRSGVSESFRGSHEPLHRLSEDERKDWLSRQAIMREAHERARQAAMEATAEIVSEIWENAAPADPENPYLVRKNIRPNGARQTSDGVLIVPLLSASGEIASVQYISADGSKRYHLSGATAAKFWRIGGMDGAETLYMAEGFATAASIHEATGQPVIVSYSASNIVPTCEIVAQWGLPIVIVADRDKSGIGQRYAEQAAAKFGARYVLPPQMPGLEKVDANDFVLAGGDLLAILQPRKAEWLVSAAEFLSQPAPLEWLVRGWIPRRALCMGWGPSGGGKTFAVLDMCLSVASGAQEWAGNRVHQSEVVYLAGEGHHGLRARIAAWATMHGSKGLDKMWVSSSGCDLDTAEGYLMARDAINETGVKPGLIVVDTLHRFLRGDENSSQDARKMIAACDQLTAEFGSSVLLVHHTGASDDAQGRARGSSAWKGALEAEFAVLPSGDSIVIAAKKTKDAELPKDIEGQLVPQLIPGWTDEDGEACGSVVFVGRTRNAPAMKRTESPMLKHWKLFERAWFAAEGPRDESGIPVLSRSAMLAKLREDGLSSTQAQTQIRVDKDGAIGHLVRNEILETTESGWKVISQAYACQL